MNKISIVVVSCMIPLTPLSAFAQDTGCQIKGAAICGLGQGAVLSSTAGDASVSRGGSFKPLQPSANLRPGDRFLLKADAGQIKLGTSCSAPISAGSLASISRRDKMTCVSETKDVSALNAKAGDEPLNPVPDLTPSGISPFYVVTGVTALAAVGITVAIVANNSISGK